MAIATGSGWVNPDFVKGMERRFGADVATVSMHYDDRPSWVAFLLDRQRAVTGARALLDAVVAAVEALPESQRPQVHVVGESLGATAGQAALSGPGPAALRDGVCSAFWLGTPGGGGGTGFARETHAANVDDPIVHARPSLALPAGAGHRYGVEQPDRLQTCE